MKIFLSNPFNQFLIALILAPIFLFFSIIYLFDTSIKETFSFIWLIFSHLDQIKNMKFETYICLLFFLMPFIAFFIFNIKPNLTSHGKAKWASISDALKMGLFIKKIKDNKKLGFMLGKIDLNNAIAFDKPLACLIVAPPGAGKSQSVAIPNLLTIKQSCVVLDIKGELCDVTAGYRQKALKNKVFVFDPMKSGERNSNDLSFNPFDKKIVEKMSIDQKVRLVNEIANTIFVSKEKSHWDEQAKNLFIFYALFDLCTKNYSTFYSLAQAPKRDFRKLIHPKSRHYQRVWEHDRDGVIRLDNSGKPIASNDLDFKEIETLYYEMVGEMKYTDIDFEKNYQDESSDEIELNIQNGKERLLETICDTARQWAGTPQDEFGSIKSTYNRFMQVFTYNQVKRATENMSFDYEDLRRDNITIYVKIAQTDIETLAPLIRILMESIGKNLLLRENKDTNQFVYLILDEFIRFGKLEFLMEMPALCRSYGVIPLYITQSYALIEKHYSKEDLRIINETVAYKILFKMNDADSAEAVSKEIGDFTRINRSRSTSSKEVVFGGSSSASKEAYKLVTAQDILNIPSDEVIILVSGFKSKPLKLKANYAFLSKELKSRQNWDLDSKVVVEQEVQDDKSKELGGVEETKEAKEPNPIDQKNQEIEAEYEL